MKGRVLKISRWAMTQVDLKTPWQARRAAKKLLVKPVSQPSDRLGRQNARGKGICHGREENALAASISPDRFTTSTNGPPDA